MATLGSYSYTLLAAFVACAYAAAAVVAGHRRHSARLVESGIGSFYLVTALMTLASAIIVRAFVIGDYSIRYVDRYSDSIQPLFYRLTSYWGGLDGSIMFWVFLLSVFGRRPRAQPAAAEPLHGDPPAVALHGSGRHDDPVRLRPGGADQRLPRRFLAACGAALDDVLVVLPLARADAGDDLGLRGAGLGRLVGLGPGGERGGAALVSCHGIPALGRVPASCSRCTRSARTRSSR